jgi:hypothetical protein
VLLSDCFDEIDSLKQAFQFLRARGHEIILLHTMAPEELTFDFGGWSRFECLEVDGRHMTLDPALVRNDYVENVRTFLRDLKRMCGETGADYHAMPTDKPMGEALGYYLQRPQCAPEGDLMNFLSPAFLIGLPLVAVPLIIHLLSRRQQKKISWGAMRFLMQAATRKRRIWKITDLLLLLLRTAAFLFFIFALARPLMPATWLGGSVPREVILVLDQSMSISRRAGSGTLFELQIQKAGEVLDNLKPSDSVRVLLAGETPEWMMADSTPATPTTIRRLRTQIGELKPTLGAADLIACVREAADLEAAKDKSGAHDRRHY